MSSNADHVVAVGKAMVQGVKSDRVTFIAASLAYYAFVSLVPLLLLALVVTAIFGGPDVARQITTQVETTLGETAEGLVSGVLTSEAAHGGATIVGVVVLVWSGLKLFRGLDVAFAEVYGAAESATFTDQLRDGLVALLAVGVGIAATVAIGALISVLGIEAAAQGIDIVGVVGTIGLALSLVVVLLPLYYVLPNRQMTVREALPGAVLAAVGWTILQTVFRIYASRGGGTDAYGVLGGVLLLVTWLYFGSLILLLGVVLNAVLGGQVDPDRAIDEQNPGEDENPDDTIGLGIMGDIDTDIEGIEDEELREELRTLRDEVASFEARVEDRTVHRERLERDLRQYVRQRMRRGKARGWGPYLVLLYGTAMTLGAFFFLDGGWAILAMVVVWLSTLGLYVLMLMVGATVGAAGLSGRLFDRLSDRRG